MKAESGDEAIHFIEGRRGFHVLWTGIRMPGKAADVDVAVRACGRLHSSPVLVVSGYASELSRRLDVSDPPAAFITKPFTLA